MTTEPVEPKIERLITMAERLIAALEADIAALEKGRLAEMRTTDPRIQTLSALYSREAAGLTPQSAREAPGALRTKLTATTTRFADVLARHGRIVTRVKNASEGMIRAVAEEVERRRIMARPYDRSQGQRPRNPGAILFNNVV